MRRRTQPVRNGRRGLTAVAAVCALGGLGTLATAVAEQPGPPPQPPRAAAPSATPTPHRSHRAATAPAPARALPASRPVSLAIPSIGVHTSLMSLGQNKDGSVEVPSRPLKAGWYRYSPTPGQNGPAVILGHVDSDETGPAVFYRLGALRPGASVSVRREDGTTAVFTVDKVREYPKDGFPTRTVYGNTRRPELRLITCGDWDADHHTYRGNTVVFAHLTRTTAKG
ncbi:class F sortase [Streptomyces montanisoli]|uniref:Class F sortase n=1 Tax=Streptomyces montanisoli TaxID=2798581 RepID=A0A940MAW1_9ACTN|nr:class F sortase [Streptomyces montanisoli]MBP0456665.1 class F sortase [Streptomyces montanisoli]